jgi:oligopeptide/dipeptide ABC transporter ATP-binding protein
VTIADDTSPLPGHMGSSDESLLWVSGLSKVFTSGRRGARGEEGVRALDEVSFDVAKGEIFGLVGESGCGKSTLARCVLRLLEPTSGRVIFDGTEVTALDREPLRAIRRRMQIVFQDPYASLDPRMTAGAIVEEPLVVHGIGDRSERAERARETLELVGLAADQVGRKPHAFSGGQRQRIGIARSLVLSPELVVLDEPVSALDVSIQAQVLNLLGDLQQRLGLTYVFIGHDLAVAEYFCDRLAVLYLGQVMELADRTTLFRSPLHPYTLSLLAAIPLPELRQGPRRRRTALGGEVTAMTATATGCPFRPRCVVGHDRATCAATSPPLARHAPGHWVACHFPGELGPDDASVFGEASEVQPPAPPREPEAGDWDYV